MIDVHTHLHPPRLFAAIRRWFAERSSWELGAQPTEPRDVAEVLRRAGVARFVFCSYAHKVGMAREINAWLAATSRELAGFGVPLATVHPHDADRVADIRAALADGCVGLKIHEDVQRVAVDDARLAPVLAEVAAHDAFLLVHVGPIPWQYDDGSGLERVRRVLDTHPGLSVVVAHMGRPDTRAYFELMRSYPRLYLDTTMVLARDSPMYDETIDRAAVEAQAARIVYGTDYPNIPYAYSSECDALRSLGLSAAAFRSVIHDNAAGLLAAAEAR